ncbi:MAG: hypothetical protein ACRDN9_20380, partial [Streptosporangiaceae bacterium]
MTIVPGLYPGRTRHVHVKAQAPYEPILTTQLYFPGEPRNRTDPLFNPEAAPRVSRRSAERSWGDHALVQLLSVGPARAGAEPP